MSSETSPTNCSQASSMSRPSKPDGEGWDFTLAIDLIHLLSVDVSRHLGDGTPPSIDPFHSHDLSSQALPQDSRDCNASQLGNLDRLWIYLNKPLDGLPPKVSTSDLENALIGGKEMRWSDEVDGTDLKESRAEDNQPPQAIALPKGQTKKEQRRLLKGRGVTTKSGALPFASRDGGLKPSIKAKQTLQNSIQTPTRNLKLPTQTLFDSLCEIHNINARPSDASIYGTSISSKPPVSFKALDLGKSAASKATLWSILIDRFVDDRKFLRHARGLKHAQNTFNTSRDGIHVFVDVSNILIGFQDALKLSRGVPISQRIQRQSLSFHNLSLILERGRFTAKRVVVGSDNIESIQEAKALGYETNILGRVRKAKQVTPRRQKLLGSGYGTSGQSSGSETNASSRPERWVEQAVDEILHLKILESVVDAETPSTIVLASGDAAEAEYSQGFLKMVERALQKKWKVELVSFRHNIGGAYRRQDFRLRWGRSFKIIELDDFVEHLLVPGS